MTELTQKIRAYDLQAGNIVEYTGFRYKVTGLIDGRFGLRPLTTCHKTISIGQFSQQWILLIKKQRPDNVPLVMTVKEAADYMCTKSKTVYDRMYNYGLAYIKKKRRIYLRRSDIDQWCDINL